MFYVLKKAVVNVNIVSLNKKKKKAHFSICVFCVALQQ